MRGSARRGFAVAAVGLTLVLAACGGDDDGGDSGSGDEGGSSEGPTGTVSINSTQPENPLIPTTTNEVGGGNIVDAMWTGLVSYDPETAEPGLAVAESIEPNEDFTQFTITIKDGWTFHDGTPVTAQSFVDAWNFGAAGENAQLNQYFFGPDGANIAGFDEVAGQTDDAGAFVPGSATADAMSGLEVVDDTTFTVTLGSPNSLFETIIGYSAFYPMPESFFTDQAAFEAHPVGNGPFEFVEEIPNQSINLTAFADYAGDEKPQVENIEYRIYADLDAAYADVVSNQLDILDKIPPVGLAGDVWKTDLEGRSASAPLTTRFTSMTFPLTSTDVWADANLRKAISKAIDREAVIAAAYGPGNYVPANSWVPPGNDGYVEGTCGEWCEFDAAAAKELYDQTAGIQGTLMIASNSDGGHREWVEAACTSITNALGVPCQGDFDPDFGSFRARVNANELTSPFRTGWVADYPSIQNFLAPLYTSNGSANDGGYSNPQFDDLIRQAAGLEGDEALDLYNQAETLLAEDMAVIPLWYDNGQRGWSENVNEPGFTWKGYVDPLSISVKN
ncbi:peptide ABC transporter substrate-binding protein [Jiangella mangrovi]|uniref:Oligopeptide transport system substrate-binding protein n=1 Tax=Jiangella mangrovi TaxID=1524084 RepID=A0A7W9GLM6_9ACTN|nr:ABC transporter substrate-binding protein [Jiangella mangrovi]MBB5785933.1 oligopeptide transport system substrate-binding protein [Jiangella mangrovi]